MRMTTILVVDDHVLNREFLVTLLGYMDYRLLEASDGTEALSIASQEHPDLIIADILMPTMDGYELVRQLRADPAVADIEVIFYTAHYLEREARSLAEACGVSYVLTKPSEPQKILEVVQLALSKHPTTSTAPPPEEHFDRDHLRLITDKLSQKADELQDVNQRLHVLLDLSLMLSAELDPSRLLERFCEAARRLVGAKYALVATRNGDNGDLRHFFTAGLDDSVSARLKPAKPFDGFLGKVIEERSSSRGREPVHSIETLGLNLEGLPVSSFVVAPVVSPTRAYGWLCLLGKIGAEVFGEEDECLTSILSAQVGRIYENGSLYAEVRRRTVELEQEVNERKRVGEALRVSERQFRSVFFLALEGMVILDDEGNFIDANPAANALFGLSKSELVEHKIFEFVRAEFDFTSSWKTFLNHGVMTGEFDLVSSDGTVRSLEFSAIAGVLPGRHFSVLHDITERKRAERALRESEERFRGVVESDMVGICFWKIDDRIIDANDEFLRILGYTKESLAKRLDWKEITPPEYRHLDAKSERELKESGRFNTFEKELLRADGTRVPVLISGALIEGYPDQAVCFALDVSNIKSLEEQLIQAQKMEAIGRLAGGVAHDFNNLLTAILGYSQLIMLRLPADSPIKVDAEEIQKAGSRAAALTNQLLAFSRKQVLQPQVVDLNAIVSDMQKMLARLIGEDIDLITRLQPDLVRVKADPGQISQVIMNLAINARDAMPEHGKLTIETSTVQLDESYISQHIDISPGCYAMLAVTDTGIGMSELTLSHIFEPFFSTKGDQGTGLGLATVYGIVKQSGGHVFVYSEPGRGTTFKIYLPEISSENVADAAAELETPSPHGTETVLIVEDEEMLRRLVRQVLAEKGYNVIDASSGARAISLASAFKGTIHLLVTDVIMPQMNGREVAEQLQATRPDLKVLYMSGYTANVVLDKGLLSPTSAYIQKPFSPDALARIVRTVLDGA